MVTLANRIAEHVGTEHPDTPDTPPLVDLRYSAQGKCTFHIARVRKGVYQVRLGKSPDAMVSFRHWPDFVEDTGHEKAWRRLRAALATGGKRLGKTKLEDLDCAEDVMHLAERLGVCINTWRLATGRADFPPLGVVARAVALPEAMVKVALRDYVQAG